MAWKKIILPVCIALGITFLCGLGMWQVQRLEWKEALIERVERQMQEAPKSVAEISQMQKSGEDIEYRPVTVSGNFLHDKEQYFFATHNSRPGWYVYTPLEREDHSIVFINRGFVPIDRKDPASRLEGQANYDLKVIGLARTAPAEKPNTFVPDNDLVKNVYYWKNLVEMMSNSDFGEPEKPLVPFFIDANNAPNPGGLPIGGVTLVSFPNSHLQYAMTWFGLAFALLCVGGAFMWSGRKSRDQSD